jgi:general secretion pathway protein G
MLIKKYAKAFTLIELLVVMAIIATLLTLVVPRYFKTVDRSQEKVLLTNLVTMRDSIDKYYGDHGHYPSKLESLVEHQYIREIPVDPITESAETWVVSPSKDINLPGIYDVHSGAPGIGLNNKPYSEW